MSVLAAACGSSSPTVAATVNGVNLKRDVLESELDAYRDHLDPSVLGVASFQGTTEGTYNADFVRQVLGFNIQVELIRQEAARRGIALDPSVKKFADDIAFQLVGDQPTFEKLPPRVQAIVNGKAEQILSFRFAVAGLTAIDDASLQKVYDANPASFKQTCPSHILVPNEADAQGVVADLKSGKSFAEVAQAKSTDTGSKSNGGQLREGGQCYTDEGLNGFVTEFADAVRKATPGQATDPVKSQFGYHVILVTGVRSSFAEVKDTIATAALQSGSEKYEEAMTKVYEDAKINVSSRYGRWDPTLRQLVANEPPNTTATPSTAPAAPASTGS